MNDCSEAPRRRTASSKSRSGRTMLNTSRWSSPRATTAPSTAANVSRGTPSQSAHLPHTPVSSTSVSPTSKKTALSSIARQGTVPVIEQFRRSDGRGRGTSLAAMLNGITISHVFVLDQDEALDFYVNKLGLEVAEDMDLGFMRW